MSDDLAHGLETSLLEPPLSSTLGMCTPRPGSHAVRPGGADRGRPPRLGRIVGQPFSFLPRVPGRCSTWISSTQDRKEPVGLGAGVGALQMVLTSETTPFLEDPTYRVWEHGLGSSRPELSSSGDTSPAVSPRCPGCALVIAGVVGLRASVRWSPPLLTLPGLLYLLILSEQNSLPGGAESRKLRLRKLERTLTGAPGPRKACQQPLAPCRARAPWRFHGELSFGGPCVGLSIWVEA